jgi:hypothetical protein
MRGTEGDAIVTFNSAHERLKDGIKRAAELEQQFSDDAMGSVERSRRVLVTQWVFLDRETDLEADLRDTADQLRDYLEQELFFQRINEIEAATKLIENEHHRRFGEALQAKVQAYTEALSQLVTVAEWPALDDTAKEVLRDDAPDKGGVLVD